LAVAAGVGVGLEEEAMGVEDLAEEEPEVAELGKAEEALEGEALGAVERAEKLDPGATKVVREERSWSPRRSRHSQL